jgi:fatty-acyl-CoA synthase
MHNDPHLGPRDANFQPLSPLDLLSRTLAVHGDRIGVIWRADQWSYSAFGDVVARMADWLRNQGVGRGDVVSVMLGNRPEMLAAHFAVPALGAVLNTINTRLAAEEIAYILTHSGSRLLICDSATRPALTDHTTPVFQLCDDPSDAEGLNFFHGPAPDLNLFTAPQAETDAIALNYTSGTTGQPKGVVCTHRGAYLNAMGNVLGLGLTAHSRYLWTLPMFHCNGWCHTWAVTAAGATHICLDRTDPALIFDAIETQSVTHMCCAPVVLYMLLDHPGEKPRVPVKVGTGGAAPTPSLLAGLDQLGFELMHLYGLTESYGPATLNDPGKEAPTDLDARADALARQGQRHLTCGMAKVVDGNGADVPADGVTVGEITLRGNTVMAGYYRDAEATEAAFAQGRFWTGDLAVVHPDGQIQICDRAKDVIISGGENISSLEVEKVLQRHPDILLAAVVAAPDAKWGETPWAFVELKPGHQVTSEELSAFCNEHLARFKRPRQFVFGPLPRTATGKIQKFMLRSEAAKKVDQ